MAAGAEQIGLEAGLPLGHAARGVAAHGIPDLDGAGVGIGRNVAQRNTEQLGRIARNTQVHELTGLERTGKLRGRDDEREDALGDLLVRNDLEIMHASRRRIRHTRSHPHALHGLNKGARHPKVPRDR